MSSSPSWLVVRQDSLALAVMHNRHYAIIHFRDLERSCSSKNALECSGHFLVARYVETPRHSSFTLASTTFDKVKNSCCRRMLRDRSPSSRLRERHNGCVLTRQAVHNCAPSAVETIQFSAGPKSLGSFQSLGCGPLSVPHASMRR